jgi:hypothetical protein
MVLYGVGDMGDDLYGRAQVFALSFLVKHLPIYFPGGYAVVFAEVFVYKAFVMAQVQVGFRAVLGNENLAVLEGAHGAGVNVNVRVKFLDGDLIPPRL